ncbi:zinc-binding dehydrogenase [Streptomyces acidiscabies]|uniref:zinc-binding dehydrogenase n=1 Tax=Streptomyces acidiscabies TaxID=42234 RepID=UPI002116C600|nr:zinc-binding dehydrogenase [Streptomyces acidiscabies]
MPEGVRDRRDRAGEGKRGLAEELGARHYIDAERQQPGAALAELGGARLILSTAAGTKPLAELVDGLAPHGRLTVVGFDGMPLQLPMGKLVMGAPTVAGHLTGSPADTEQAMRFAVTTGVRPVVETVALEEGKARFREREEGRRSPGEPGPWDAVDPEPRALGFRIRCCSG